MKPMILYWHRLAPLMLGIFLTIACAPSVAALPAADEQAIQRVVLNDELLDKLTAIKIEGLALGLDDREITDPAAFSSLDALAQSVANDPRVVQLLARHRISARDYMAAYLAIMRASTAVQLGSSSSLAANGTTSAHVAFVKSRMSKIEALFEDEDNVDAEDTEDEE